MEAAYDEHVRIVTSIRVGQCSAIQALDRYGSDARGQPAYDAGVQLGMMLTSIYLMDYFLNPEFRAEIRHALNRGESMHTLQRAIHDGEIPNDRAKRDEPLAEDLRRIASTRVEDINFRGMFDFPVEKYAERILPSSAASSARPVSPKAHTGGR